MQVINTKDLKRNLTINVIIYGAPGIGKTTFCATAPKPLIIDLEGGSLSIADRNVDLVQVTNINDVQESVNFALKNGYKTIVFDSLTRYAEVLMDDILAKNNKITAQIQHWGELVTRIKKMMWVLQAQNINTIFTCLEKETDEGDQLIKRPSLNGQLVQAIPAIVDVTGYLYATQTSERLLSINPTDKWYAKHRTILANKIDEDLIPDFRILSERIFGIEQDVVEQNILEKVA